MSKLSMLSESTGVPYSQLVEQKREGNRNFMIDSGLLSAKRAISDTKSAESVARKVSAAKRKKQKENAPPLEKRKSPRLSPDGSASASSGSNYFVPEPEPVPTSEFFHDRLNSGENIDVFSAIALDEGEEEDEDYIRDRAGITDMRDQLVSAAAKSTSTSKSKSANKNNFTSARPVMLNDNVEKLTNQRAYGITTHPTLPVVVIGDKVGSVGLWNSSKSAQNSQTAFFTIAKRPIHSVQFNPTGDKLYMSSTDGTIREWDTNSPSNVLTQVFASYDDHADFKNEPGFGVEKDGKFWTSHSVLNSEANGIYVTSNCGTLINVDFRTASKVVFDVALSTHKLNTLSLHGNGHSVAVGGNEGVAKIFDIRALKKNKKKSVCTPVATYNSTRSINSAMFNCDGSCLAVTSFDDTIGKRAKRALWEMRIRI